MIPTDVPVSTAGGDGGGSGSAAPSSAMPPPALVEQGSLASVGAALAAPILAAPSEGQQRLWQEQQHNLAQVRVFVVGGGEAVRELQRVCDWGGGKVF